MNRYVVLILAVSALVVFCGGEPTATPDSVATQVAVEKAAGATLPAEVPTLTEAPAPAATPEPTEGAAVVYLPEEARQALDDHIAEVEGPDFEYSIVSAQRATQLEAIHASSSVEQAWCIAIDQTRKLQLEIIEDHGPVERFTRVVDSWSVEYNVLLAISKWYHTRKEYVWTVGPL